MVDKRVFIGCGKRFKVDGRWLRRMCGVSDTYFLSGVIFICDDCQKLRGKVAMSMLVNRGK